MSLKEKILSIFNLFSKDKSSTEHTYEYTTEENGYIIEDNGYILTFKKDGVIHRDAGPAVFWTKSKKTKNYLNLEDKNLYKIKIKELSPKEQDFWMVSMFHRNMEEVSYYLDGNMYSEEEFTNILKRKSLSDQLEKELPIRKNLTKKLKI
jgi:nitrous oxide reductase